MRKLAVFVEGYTELLFLDRLVYEIAERSQVAIQHRKIRGGGSKSRKPRRLIELQTPTLTPEHTLFFLIVDCGGEDLVRQRIQEEHNSLTKAGYEKIIGLRDVFPKYSQDEIPKLKKGLKYGIKTSLIPVQFILSVMELEAWFLAEYNHFPKVDSALTTDAIQTQLGFNPIIDDMTNRAEPANDLVAAYAIVGKTYIKGNSQSTIEKLDYEHIYEVLPNQISQLNELITAINSFIQPPILAH
jgi:hypothetical protein